MVIDKEWTLKRKRICRVDIDKEGRRHERQRAERKEKKH